MREFDDHIINEYARGVLNDDLSDQLEKAALLDVGLRERIDLERQLMAGVKHYEALRIKRNVQLVVSRYKRRRKWFMWLLLSVIAMVLVYLYYVVGLPAIQSKPKTNQQLYAAYYEVPILSSTSRAEGPAESDTLLMLREAYLAGEFGKVRQLGSLLGADRVDSKTSLMIAISFMEVGDWLGALGTLDAIVSTSEYLDDIIDWYRCLILIQLDQTEKAKTILLHTAGDAEHDFNKKAEALLRELR